MRSDAQWLCDKWRPTASGLRAGSDCLELSCWISVLFWAQRYREALGQSPPYLSHSGGFFIKILSFYSCNIKLHFLFLKILQYCKNIKILADQQYSDILQYFSHKKKCVDSAKINDIS